MAAHEVSEVDPFDLPEWLGERDVTWIATSSLTAGHRVTGVLRTGGPTPEQPKQQRPSHGEPGEEEPCDLLAGDLAYPSPVLSEEWRSRAHHAWSLGESVLVQYDGRLTMVIPGLAVDAETALEAIRRLAKALGASQDRYTVALRL